MARSGTPAPARRTDVEAFGQLLANAAVTSASANNDLAIRLCAVTGRPTFTRHEISRYERGTSLTALANATLQ